MNRDEIIAENPIVEFVRKRGHELKRAGENFVTSGCPVSQHKRGHRPVTIYPQTESWRCHDCAKGGSLIDWLMLEKNISVGEAMAELAGGPNGAAPKKKRLIEATYDYLDANGKLVSQTVRWMKQKKGEKKRFSQRRPDGEGWSWSVKGVRRVLYHLPEVVAAQTVVVVEGEKDADNLRDLGFTATTNPMGAGKWRKEYAETLRGKDVVVFGDRGDADGAGEKHTAEVLASLGGVARSLKHAEQPDGFHDISDYIASLPPQTAKDTIRKLVEETPVWTPSASDERLSFRSPDEILAMPRNLKANFLGDYLLGIALSLVIAGIGGIGKSRLLMQLLVDFILERIWCGIETHHTKGKPWMLIQTQNSVLRLQDDLDRLRQYAGGDWELVEKNLVVHTLETDRDLMLHLSDQKNARDLESAIRDYNPLGVAFDPLNELAVGDLSKDLDMMATCHEIARISRAGNPERAIVIATHALTGLAGMKKAFGFEAAGFGRNSKMLQSWTRAFINVVPGTEDYRVLILTCGKNNNGKMFEPFSIRLNPDTMIYEPEPDFDISAFREQIESPKKKKRTFTDKPEVVAEIDWRNHKGDLVTELDRKWLAKSLMDEIPCSSSTAYRLIEAAVIHRPPIIRFSKLTQLYAKKPTK